MPLIDMPLEELQNYAGTNPKPEDFDTYWERALAELDRTDPAYRLTPSPFQAPAAQCFDLYFTGTGNATIHAKYLRPARPASVPHPAVIQFHGYSGRSDPWASLLSWTASGFSILSMDVRGQGGLSEDSGSISGTTLRGHIIRGLDDHPDKLLYRSIYLDTVQLARITMQLPEVDPHRIGVFGASQGGGLTLACAALVPEIKRAAPLYPFLCDYRRVWEMDLAKQAYEELQYFFRSFDPRHLREEEIFRKLGYIDNQYLAERIEARVLMGTGLMDDVCPPSTQFAAYNRIRSHKEMVIYPDFRHESIPDFVDQTYQFMLGL